MGTVTVSRKFKDNFEIAVALWKSQGDTDEHIAALKNAIRVDLAEGEGFIREGVHRIPDQKERAALWEEYFQAISNEQAALDASLAKAASGIQGRIVKRILSEKEKKK